MNGEETGAEAEKPRATRKPRKKAGKDAVKQKRTFCLEREDDIRLTVHAAHLGIDRSELVARMIRTHLRRFVVSDMDKGSAARGMPDGPA